MRRELIINKLRELGFKHRRDAWRVQMWRRARDTLEIAVPKRDVLDEDWVRSALRQCGCEKEEIERFIHTCRN